MKTVTTLLLTSLFLTPMAMAAGQAQSVQQTLPTITSAQVSTHSLMTYDSHGGRIAIEHSCKQPSKFGMYDSHGDRIDEDHSCNYQILNTRSDSGFAWVSPDEERNSDFA
ncbi:hypothetical protein VIN01S_30730 [Vibrio inusitatus NBRC 102082]|uniref:Uncharacterized protein n=1 Tax=Vibrio inusitatus NBRC 102082 TaxID=1219070 RepID=A0A4Y3HYL5_9VIBR|nr:hypothetical protein [Vibrio inusitatus]GEA52269.1 hypothetical protein VIN01S_30730 [Vibrio inusitatus NBRC 102082]